MKTAPLLAMLFSANVQAAFECMPATFGGKGTPLVIEQNSVGFSLGWLCPQRTDGKIQLYQWWGHWTELPGDWQRQIMAAIDAGTADQLAAKAGTATKDANGAYLFPADLAPLPVDAFNRLLALRPTMQPPPPPPPGSEVWVVKPSGTSATRVVYAYLKATNSRGPVTSLTVPVGTVCDQSIQVTERVGTLTNVYMGVPGGIALCAKQ